MDIIKRINELIIALNQTSRSFAIACGIKYTTLNNYLVGRRAIGYDTIDAILTGFPEVSAEWLMRGTGPMFKKDIEEAHMRNRQLIANWVYEHATNKEVEIIARDGKHYLRINDYQGLRRLYGELLAEIQRITSEGDYAAAKELVEKYAVKVNPELHQEILARYKKLNLAPYKGFVNPVYTAVRDAEGNITDVKIDFSEGYVAQHLRYSRDYSPLPDVN